MLSTPTGTMTAPAGPTPIYFRHHGKTFHVDPQMRIKDHATRTYLSHLLRFCLQLSAELIGYQFTPTAEDLRAAVVKLIGAVDCGDLLAVLAGNEERFAIELQPGWDYEGWLMEE